MPSSPALLSRRAFLGAAALAPLALHPAALAEGERPDLVFILADDLRADTLGFMGDPLARTPNIDRLAAEGAVFERHYVVLSLCAPSRATHLTGCYPHTTGIIDNKNRRLSQDFPVFPLLLQRAGYRTAFIGKWHMDDTAEPRPGFDRWVSFRGQGSYTDPTLNIDGVERVHRGYMTDLLTEQALQFLNQPSESPRLLFLAHKAVHAPFTPAPRHVGALADAPLPPIPTGRTRGQPSWVKSAAKNEAMSADERAKLIRGYHEALMAVDDSVGAVARAAGDRAVVMFSSDNGFFFGEHGLSGKMIPYEDSLRLPLIVRAPGRVAPGRRISALTANIDVAPTMLELGGVTPPRGVQGRSLVDVLTGKQDSVRERLLFELFSTGKGKGNADGPPPAKRPHLVGLHTPEQVLVTAVGHPDWDELYDLREDPEQRQNLASKRPKEREALHAALEEEKDAVGWRVPTAPPMDRPYTRTGGCVLDYNFQHDQGDRVVDDSGEDHEGLAVGARLETVDGRIVRRFGGEDRVLVPRTLALDPSRGPWTVAAELRADDGVAIACGSKGGGYVLGLSAGRAVFGVAVHGKRIRLDGPEVAGRWVKLMGVIGEDLVARLFVDGAEVASAPIPAFMRGDPEEGLQIGADPGRAVIKGSRPLVGVLGRVRIWSGGRGEAR